MSNFPPLLCGPAQAPAGLLGASARAPRAGLVPAGEILPPPSLTALRTPFALRTSPLRGHVLRAPLGLAHSLSSLATAAPSRGKAQSLRCASRRTAGRAVVLEARFRGRLPFALPFALPFEAAHRCSVARRRRA
jgi:hypothetical protein